MSDERRIAIVGAGPAGLRAASYAGFIGLKPLIFDQLPFAGGQISLLYPWKPIPDVGMYPWPRGGEFVAMLKGDAEQYHPEWHLGEQVTGLTKIAEKQWHITSDKDTYNVGAIIVSAGIGAMNLNRLPNADFAQFEGRGLAYYSFDMNEARSKNVLLIGGGAGATEAAPYIAEIASTVTLIHRRDEWRDDAEPFLEKLAQSSVAVFKPYELSKIHGTSRVEGVALTNSKTGDTVILPCDLVVAFIGYEKNLGPIASWGLKMRGKLLQADERFQCMCDDGTPAEGVFAIAECIPPSALRMGLIQTWLSEAVHAVSFASSHLTGKRAFQGWGTVVQDKKGGAG